MILVILVNLVFLVNLATGGSGDSGDSGETKVIRGTRLDGNLWGHRFYERRPAVLIR